MDLFSYQPGFLLALMGWAATLLLIENGSRLTVNDRRAMTVCSWMLWMIPGVGTFVLDGLLTTDTAALIVAASTIVLGLIVVLGAVVRFRTRP